MDEPLQDRAWRIWEAGDYEQALPLLQALHTQTADLESAEEILDAIAVCYGAMKQYDNAIEMYHRILETSPDDVYTLANLGKTFFFKNDKINAREFYEKAVALGDTDEDDLMQLSRLYYQQNYVEKALETLSILTRHYPENALAHETIGYIEAERQNYAKSASAYQKAMALDDENPRLVRAGISLLINMRDFEMAKRAIALFREDDPQDAYLLYYLALAEHHTGNSEVAITHLQQALEIQPSLTPAQELLLQIQ